MLRKYLLRLNLICSLLLPAGNAAHAQRQTDEALFRIEFKKLQKLAQKNDFRALEAMMHFPFYTEKADREDGKTDPVGGISKKEFKWYQADIYNPEVRHLLPRLSEEALNEIQGEEDTYFSALRKLTDKGSKIYEVYTAYDQPGRNSGGFFSFTFGRINGRYLLLAYYGKWPLK